MSDYRAELQALIAAYDEHGGRWPESDVDALCQAVQRARAALDGPAVPEGRESAAVEGEAGELAKWLYHLAAERTCNRRRGIRPHPSALTRAAVLLEQLSASQPLRPIPVSERLPEPEAHP